MENEFRRMDETSRKMKSRDEIHATYTAQHPSSFNTRPKSITIIPLAAEIYRASSLRSDGRRGCGVKNFYVPKKDRIGFGRCRVRTREGTPTSMKYARFYKNSPTQKIRERVTRRFQICIFE